jgi:hypothetical protein
VKVIGRDIGTALDERYQELERRARIEAERAIRIEPFEGAATSNVEWVDGEVVISLHSGVPTHALAHIFGVALEHVRQRLDFFPDVVAPDGELPEGSGVVRQALRELVLEPEADMFLASLHLDARWESEQRHEGMKELLREPPEEWNEEGAIGNDFMALQYARFSIQHPPEMWAGLRKTMEQRLPLAAERGKQALAIVRTYGWGGPGACLESLVGVRNELMLQDLALVEDRRSGERL